MFVLAACCLQWQSASAGHFKPVRRVLVLIDGNLATPAADAADQENTAGLKKPPYAIERYSEYTESVLSSDGASHRKLREWYRDRKPHGIIAAGPSSIKFMVKSHEKLFGDTPVVLCASSVEQGGHPKLDSHFTGVWMTIDPTKTLEAALQLQPSTHRVVVVGGVSSYGKSVEVILREYLRSYESKLEFEYLTDLTMPAVLERLRHLSDSTLVLYTSLTQDADGTGFISASESLPMVVSVANAPVFRLADTLVGQGTVGGYVVSFAAQSRVAATMAMRVLQRERPQDIPIVTGADVYMFDWRALQRWRLRESALPPGSVVLYRQPAAWQSYKRYIIGAIFVILVETLLVLGLLWQRARRRKVEAELVVTNDQLRLAMESGKAVGWEWDLKSGRDSWFGDLKTMFGISSDAYVGRVGDFYRYVHPEDRQSVSEAMTHARKSHEPYTAEFRVVWPDGALRWVTATGQFYYSPKGEPQRMLGMAQDITERKRVEEALRESEERLRLAVQAGRMYAFEWDMASDVIVRSGQCKDILNWMDDPTRDTGRQFVTSVHPDDREAYASPQTWLTSENPIYQTSYRVLRPDGTVLWLEASGRVLFDAQGKRLGIVGLVADVTARKLAEQAQRESDERLRLAQEAVHVGVFEWDVLKNENRWSPELERIYGLTPGSFGGTYEAWIARVHPDDRERFKWDDQVNVQEGGLFDSQYRIVRPSGEIRWLSSRGTLSCDSAGRPVRLLGFSIDITDRKRAEEALRESEARERARVKQLETLLDAAPITILFAADPECKSIMANRTGSELHRVPIGTNFSKSAFPIGPLLPFRVMRNGVEIPGEELPLQRAAATGIAVIGESSTLVFEDGTERHMIGNTAPLFGEDGKPCGAVGAFVDITERKQAEEALRESEERFRLVANTAPVMIWMSGADKLCTYFNTPWLAFTGRSIQAELGNGWAEGVHPEDFKTCLETYTKAFDRREKFSMEYRLRRYDGEYRWVMDNGVPRFNQDGSFAGYIGSCVDVTELKRADDALRANEEKLRLLLESTAEAIYGIDLQGRCTFCNPACLRALGYESADELLGKNMHQLIQHTRGDGTLFPQEECGILGALRTGEGVHFDDEVLWRANGTSFPAECWSYPQRRGHEVVGAVVAFVDITERKVAEAALASVSRRLIEAQEKERTRIARELHDDIGQRLALLTIELDQLRQNSPDLHPEIRSRIGELHSQTSELATDIQFMSHDLHSSKLEYLGLTTAMKGFCKEFSEQQSVEVLFAHDDIPSTIPQQVSLCLFRVLQEALQNAVKHSGGQHFDVELRYASDTIHITVRDSGAGFDVEQAMNTSGLGLVSMAERVKLVDGRLSIDSQPQRGTAICASVPLSKAARASA